MASGDIERYTTAFLHTSWCTKTQRSKKTHIHGLLRLQRRLRRHGPQNTIQNHERPRIPGMLHQHVWRTLQNIRYLLHDTTWQYPHNTHTSRHTTRGYTLSLSIHNIHGTTSPIALHREQRIQTHTPTTNIHMYLHDIRRPRLCRRHEHYNRNLG